MKKMCLLFVAVISIVFTVSCVSKEMPVAETYYETAYKTEIDRMENITILKPEAEWWVRHPTDRCRLLGLKDTYYYGYKIDMPESSNGQVKISTMKNPPYKFPMTALDWSWYVLIVDLTGTGQLPPLSEQYGELPKTINDLVTSTEYHPFPGEPDREEASRLTCLFTTFEGFEKSQRLLACSKYPLTDTMPGFTFDAKGVEEFAIIILATGTVTPTVQLTSISEISHQVPYQVEKQRTVIQTKQVPFWEAILSK